MQSAVQIAEAFDVRVDQLAMAAKWGVSFEMLGSGVVTVPRCIAEDARGWGCSDAPARIAVAQCTSKNGWRALGLGRLW